MANPDRMIDRDRELEAAAEDIDPESLEAAKAAVAFGCEEQLRWIETLSLRLDTVDPGDLQKFARALALIMLGHLPTRPGTCPFCLQYGSDRGCYGCGYALTHGRCDRDDSAFNLFIEAFQELGRTIYQDTGELHCPQDKAERLLRISLLASAETAKRMLADLLLASALQFMERKAAYLDRMIGLLPLEILSEETGERRRKVQRILKDYW
ncbi:Uncharacterised protein [uncultured archaeon]|nr:Uncharacterised protein [uncultured archaeon]